MLLPTQRAHERYEPRDRADAGECPGTPLMLEAAASQDQAWLLTVPFPFCLATGSSYESRVCPQTMLRANQAERYLGSLL